MPKGRIEQGTRRKVLLNAGGLFEALGLELTEEQRAAVEHKQEQRAKRNSESREYRATHRDELNAKDRERYAAHKDEFTARRRKYHAEHRDVCNAKYREYYAANKNEKRAKKREYYVAHRAEILAKRKAYRAAQKHRDEGAATFPKTSPPVGEQDSIRRPAVIDQRGEAEART